MPTTDAPTAEIVRALTDLVAALVPSPRSLGGRDAPEHLQLALNGGTDPHIGAHYADLVARDRELSSSARILDLGCGYGRVAAALVPMLTDDQFYVGLDPHAEAVAWARRAIAAGRDNVAFERIDVVSQPYNPEGELHGAGFRFPFDDHSLDRVFMISVLTHVDLATVRNYLEEAARVLRRDTGRLVATFFLLDAEVEGLIADGRSAWELPWRIGESRVEHRSNPELVIAHPRSRVEEILRGAGFADFRIVPGHWSGRPAVNAVDFQDTIVADFGTVVAAPLEPWERAEAAALEALAGTLVDNGVAAEQVAPFLVWALGALVNIVHWEDQGLELFLAAARAEGHGLALDGVRGVDRAGLIPAVARRGEFVAIGEAALLDAVRRTAPPGDREAAVALLADVVHGGLAVDRAVLDGQALLRRQGTAARVAPIPPRSGGTEGDAPRRRRGIASLRARFRGR